MGGPYAIPSNTKLLLTKNDFEITIFGKITNLARNSLKMSFFPGHFGSSKSLNNSENYFSGNYFRNNFVSEGIFCRNPLILTDFYAIQTPIVWHSLGAYFLQIWGVGLVRIIFRMGGFRKGGVSNSRFVLKPDVAIASEVSI